MTASPDKQAEQIMAIYPIVNGQKSMLENSKRLSLIEPTPKNIVTGSNMPQGDLVDFGQKDGPSDALTTQQTYPETTQQPLRSPDEIEKMLHSTGKPAEGPLIDFAQDLKKDLPENPRPTQ